MKINITHPVIESIEVDTLEQLIAIIKECNLELKQKETLPYPVYPNVPQFPIYPQIWYNTCVTNKI